MQKTSFNYDIFEGIAFVKEMSMKVQNRIARLVVMLGVLLFIVQTVTAQSQTNQFFYDNLGRLSVVLGTNGTDAAFYDYDAVGNITAIRSQTVGAVNLFVFSPGSGGANTTVTLQGTGFSTNAAQNTVLFCGSITAQVVSATATQLKVLVPTNASNCQISVITPSGTATNAQTFIPILSVVVSPSAVIVPVLQSEQFAASVNGTTNQNVTWSINGLIPAGTNSVYGLITTNGFYTAPSNAPPGSVVAIHAKSVVDPDPLKEGLSSVTVTSLVLQAGPVYSHTISAQPGVPTILGPIYSPTVSAGPTP